MTIDELITELNKSKDKSQSVTILCGDGEYHGVREVYINSGENAILDEAELIS